MNRFFLLTLFFIFFTAENRRFSFRNEDHKSTELNPLFSQSSLILLFSFNIIAWRHSQAEKDPKDTNREKPITSIMHGHIDNQKIVRS